MDGKRKLLYVLRESPKIGFLLIIGAMILFPLYMMIVISLMTPAQLERFPWFPTQIDEPRDIKATRSGQVALEPARLLLENDGEAVGGQESADAGAAGAREIPILMNDRFYFHLPGVDPDQMQWQVKPEGDKPAVVAEYRASVVCQVGEPQPNQYTVMVARRRGEGDQGLEIPEGFTSLMPGLRQRALMSAELSACEQARKEASDALKAAERIDRVSDPEERARRRQEAVLRCQLASRYVEVGEAALKRAEVYAAAAEKSGVTAQGRVDDARTRMDVARRRVANAKGLLGVAVEQATAEVRTAMATIEDLPADLSSGFVVDRGDAVAVLMVDRPTTVTRLPGRAVLKTEWTYPYNPVRPFVIRSLVAADKTDAVAAGEPLAEMSASADMTLTWSDGAWRLGGLALERYLYPGFRSTIAAAPAGTAEGQKLELSAGTVVARATMPKAMVWRENDSLIVGLAVAEAEGSGNAAGQGRQWRIELGAGRWSYQLYGGTEEPFVIRYTGPADLPTGQAVDVAAGAALAELVIHRDRTLLGLKDVGWSDQGSNVFLSVPAGFESLLPAATAIEQPESRQLPHDTVLGRLVMPKVELIVNEHHLIVRMSGAEFGSGQWEYPLGEVETLAVRSPLQSAEGEEGAAAEFRPVDNAYDLPELAALRQQIDGLRRKVEKTSYPIVAKRAAARELDLAERRYARLMQEQMPADTVATLVATRPALLIYDNQWLLDGRPIVWPAGFVPLDGPSELLAGTRSQVLVEPGAVVALLRAERPHEWAAERGTAGSLVTYAEEADEGRALRVRFEHDLQMPVRSIVKVRQGQTVEAGATVLSLFTPLRFDTANYKEAWVYVKDFILNTVVVAVATVVFSLLFASMSAFVFARYQFPGKALFYGAIIVLLMIPGVLNLVPLYVIVKNLGLLESTWIHAMLVLVLPAVAGGQVMSVYIMRNNLETLAKDLFDAAKIDGASNWQTYWHIALPLSRPIMGTLAIFALLSQWNNFIWPWLVIKEERLMPVTAGLAKLEGQHLSDYGLQMAGAVLASLPLVILFFFMMNLFIRGMQSGAIKA